MKIHEGVIENVARVCHEANRAFCVTLEDTSQKSWDEAPDWQKTSARNGVVFHWTEDRTPEQSHENWMKEKAEAGWKYGPVKDAQAKTHPCMRPYAELEPEQRMKDSLFRSIVHAFKAEISR